MKKIQRMSDAEKQIMSFIWKTGRPVTTAEIMQNLPEEKEWKQNTVITFFGPADGKRVSQSHKNKQGKLLRALLNGTGIPKF
jgi:Penicillinase repressor.